MKPLIRPFLFAVVGLGLFFAVTAWILGQWWCAFLISPDSLSLNVGPSGYVIGWEVDPNFEWDGSVGRAPKRNRLAWAFEQPIPPYEYACHGFGFTLARFARHAHISLCHWSLTSMLLASNIALHFIYRAKRIPGQGDSDA